MSTIIQGKMKSFKKSIALLSVFFLLTGCPEDLSDDVIATIKVSNNSTIGVVYLPWYISKDYVGDSIFSPQVSPWNNIANFTIEKDTFGTFEIQERIKNEIQNNVNLLIFFFDPDTLEQVPWERIARENINLKRVDIHSWEELEDCNYEVAYP
jgi:hypothetical protein